MLASSVGNFTDETVTDSSLTDGAVKIEAIEKRTNDRGTKPTQERIINETQRTYSISSILGINATAKSIAEIGNFSNG